MSEELKPCPFCGGEAEFKQTGRYELTLRCVGYQPATGLQGCGPKYVQKVLPSRHTLDWLRERMTKVWNTRADEATITDLTKRAEEAERELAEMKDRVKALEDECACAEEEDFEWERTFAEERKRAEVAELEIERLKDILGDPEGVVAHSNAIIARAESAERRAYELAVAIMGGEDAPGYADSIETDVLAKQLQSERSERNAWTDAAVKVATEAAERRLAEAERVIAPFANYGTWTIVWSNDDIVSCEFAVGTLRAARKWQEEGR